MELPPAKQAAFVVAHPAHLLSVLGLVLKYQPRILFLTHAFAGLGSGQAKLIQEGFRMVGLEDHITDLGIDEHESYRHSIARNFDHYYAILPRIIDWLEASEADVIFGDAYELSNYQHDVGRMLLDHAINALQRKGRTIANYEFPLSVRADRPKAELEFGRFVEGTHATYTLNEMECALKQRIVATAKLEDSFIAHVAPHFPGLETEQYRPVPHNRDYLTVPAGISRYYDDRGIQEVQAGRYPQVITFEEHFRPLVEYINHKLAVS
jgi:hypothetical protein